MNKTVFLNTYYTYINIHLYTWAYIISRTCTELFTSSQPTTNRTCEKRTLLYYILQLGTYMRRDNDDYNNFKSITILLEKYNNNNNNNNNNNHNNNNNNNSNNIIYRPVVSRAT
jgi:hypothetical protein